MKREPRASEQELLSPLGGQGPQPLIFLDTQVDKKKKSGQMLACKPSAHVTEPVIGNKTHVGDNTEQPAAARREGEGL